MVWIQVCYYVEFKNNTDDTWTWRYVNEDEKNVRVIFVRDDISFLELEDAVMKLIKFDSISHVIELRSLNPRLMKLPVPPVKIDSDDTVKWYISICDDHPLCVTLVEKLVEEEANNVEVEQNLEVEEETNNDNLEAIETLTWENQIGEPLEGQWDIMLENRDSPMETNVEVEEERGTTFLIEEARENFSTQYAMVGNASCSMSPLRCPSSVMIPENEDVQCNNIFSTKKDLVDKILLLAVKYHFEFRVVKSTKTLYVVACIERNCPWRLRAVKIDSGEIFVVRKYVGNHTCSMSVRRKDHRHATYKLIGKHISEKYKDVNRIYKPRDIIFDVQEKFGITISYTKAFMAKHHGFGLIRGCPEESYAKLPSYCYYLEQTNPGTVTFIQTSEDGHFKFFFMALGQCIRGFRSSIRRVISVDGTFLTGRYRGTLLIATCQDANLQIYPLAWAIVDSENHLSWTFFFEKLKDITGDSPDLVIVSDRGSSIPGAFVEVFEHAHHGYCNYHLLRNLKSEFPRLELDALFWATAEAYTMSHFESNMAALCNKHKKMREYLEKAELHRWARAHFRATRFNIMTTNNAESLNSVLKRAREFPILGLIEHIRATLQKWFYDRNLNSTKCSSILTPPFEQKMRNSYNESNGLEVLNVSPMILQVGGRHIVDLEERLCTCRKFQVDMFPCAHAIAAIRFENGNGYTFCTGMYSSASWTEAYSEPIHPLPSETDWMVPEQIMSRTVLPPLSRRPRGRPTFERKKSAGEARKKSTSKPRQMRKCSKCSKPGHNRGKCEEINLNQAT